MYILYFYLLIVGLKIKANAKQSSIINKRIFLPCLKILAATPLGQITHQCDGMNFISYARIKKNFQNNRNRSGTDLSQAPPVELDRITIRNVSPKN